MTAEQQAALMKLIGHYTGLANDTTAVARMAEIQSTQDQTYLAWYDNGAAVIESTGLPDLSRWC